MGILTPKLSDPFDDIIKAHAKYIYKSEGVQVDEETGEETSYLIEEKMNELNSNNESRNKCKCVCTDRLPFYNPTRLTKGTRYRKDKDNRYPSENRSLRLKSSISTTQTLYPSEIWKTVLALIILLFVFLLNIVSICFIHDKVPDNVSGPLPDVVLDSTPIYPYGLDITEFIIIFVTFTVITSIILFHKHRSIILRRIFLMLSILYLYRTITMSVTILPTASKTYQCAPKLENRNYTAISHRIISMLPKCGLSVISPQVMCGDLIFSGHTVVLILLALVVSEYTTPRLCVFQWIYWYLAWLGIILLELAHGHYMIDVLIAYFLTTRLFWTYHTLANNENMKMHYENNYYAREWWFRIFIFFEKNIKGGIPNEYDFLLRNFEDHNTSSLV